MPSLFGGGSDMADAAQSAAQAQSAAAERAAQLKWDMFQQARKDVAPWTNLGTATVPVLGGLFNIPGYDKVDPTATLQATPGYNWTQGQGLEGLSRYAAAKGLTYSGPEMKGVTDWSQNLALNKAWNPYVNQLNTFSGQGLGAGTQTGNWGQQTAAGMGQDYLMAGQAQGQGIWNAALANQKNNNTWSNLLGMGAGLLAAPFTGGTSLLGSAISGLGSLFGGGSGGGISSYLRDGNW